MTPGGHRVPTSPLVLATGQINASDQLVIELVQASDTPAMVLVRWPEQPTISPPSRFNATAAAVMKVMANAVVAMEQRKASER